MKKLDVPFIEEISRTSPVAAIAERLDEFTRNGITQSSWPAFEYRPAVDFVIGHGNDCIVLKYYVTENVVQARYGKVNEPVYKDSCVEFFLALGDEESYYNFEFNCIGACLAGYGSGRNDRKLLPETVLEKIRYRSVLQKEKVSTADTVHWELTVQLPLDIFHFHRLTSLRGLRCRVNFYKCGDDLPQPHFLSWSPIESAQPDFHLPVFFGQAEFVGGAGR